MHNFFHLIIEYFYRPIYRALELKMFLTLPVVPIPMHFSFLYIDIVSIEIYIK